MAWSGIDTKPPFKYEEDGDKELNKETVKNETEDFTKELKSGISKPEPEPEKKPNEVIFDSHKGYKGKIRESE